jgi:hypothetical protein
VPGVGSGVDALGAAGSGALWLVAFDASYELPRPSFLRLPVDAVIVLEIMRLDYHL